METLSNLAASPIALTLRGTTYLLRPLHAKNYGAIEARIREQRIDPLDLAAEKIKKHDLPEPLAKELLAKAWDESMAGAKVTPADIGSFLVSIDGICFVFWLAARESTPGLTLDAVGELLTSLSQAEMNQVKDAMDRASGFDPNADGRSPETTASPKSTRTGRPRGAKSSAA